MVAGFESGSSAYSVYHIRVTFDRFASICMVPNVVKWKDKIEATDAAQLFKTKVMNRTHDLTNYRTNVLPTIS